MDLIQKRNCTSPIWSYFGFESDGSGLIKDDNKAICKLCYKTICVKFSNTSNLMSHLKVPHASEYASLSVSSPCRSTPPKRKRDDLEPGQQTITTAIGNSQPYKHSSTKWKQLTESVARFITKESLPLYIVEKKGFLDMLSVFDTRYELPSRKHFSTIVIPKMYTEVRERVQLDLQQASYFALTTDLWSSRGMTPYLGLTVHYIDETWTLQSRNLQTLYFPDDHTAENLCDVLKLTLGNWGLAETKLSAITTDNGANVKRAMDLMSWTRLSCFGHNLHLSVNGSFSSDTRVLRVVGLCKTLVSAFHYSWKKQRNMKVAQEEENLPQHKLIVNCETRWGSKYAMIERIVEQEPAIRKVLSQDRISIHLLPSWQDMQVMEAFCAALEPVSHFTDMLCAENYVSLSSVYPFLKKLETEILLTASDEHTLTSEIKDKIKADILRRYSDSKLKDVLTIASFLDPRFKKDYLTEAELDSVCKRLERRI